MQNLISAQEAFNAVVAGKHVLCRAVGEFMDFDDLDQFPATIFAKTGYEFCIKIETIEVAGITFTKPLTLDEVTPGMDMFVIQPTGVIYHYKYGKCGAQDTAINQGFAQRDAENAKLQIKALCLTLGCKVNDEQLIVPVGTQHEKPKATRKTKAKPATAVADDLDVVVDRIKNEISKANTLDEMLVIDKELTSLSKKLDRDSLEALTYAFVSKKSQLREKTSQSNIQITEVTETTTTEDNIVSFDSVKADMKTEKSLRDRIAAAEKIEDLEALLPELKKLHGESGHTVMTAYEQKSQKLKASESLDIDKLRELTLAAEEALTENQVKSKALKASFQTELSRSQNVLTVENVISSINKNEDLTQEDKADLLKLGDLRKKDIVNAEYDEKLENLMYRASIAETPAEANAQIRYTKGWTEAQLAPLHRAISKRLTELNKDSVSDPAPSLMRDIQNAQDLTELDALEIDVSSRAPDMQKVLMAEIVKRRFELENS